MITDLPSILSEIIKFHHLISKWFNFVVVWEGVKDINSVSKMMQIEDKNQAKMMQNQKTSNTAHKIYILPKIIKNSHVLAPNEDN